MEDSQFWVIAGGIAVFLGASMIYFVLMIYYPEWVGINGPVAREAELSHEEGVVVIEKDFADPLRKEII